ncbi:cytochrome b [Methylobacillus sp.]|uniref:cytochrome b n=1 Tax=Methylobacillus sp. TaxID=56818 RepID=UPI002FE0A7F1
MVLLDGKEKYGLVSRLLHWGMAALFAWQFTGMILLAILGKTPLVKFFLGTHGNIGVLLLTLIVLRAIWALSNASRRPAAINIMAQLGHLALYGLVLIIPTLALIRSYGSGRAFVPFGIPFWDASEKIEWMVDLGDMFHGELAWLLLALIAGHIVMALWHRTVKRDRVWERMA